ncbi:hypothetical protein CAJAP_08763 [Camponotus japonicus]
MPGCCVESCKNRTDNEKSFCLFRIPSEKERREEWLKLIGRNTLPPMAIICEVHFDERSTRWKKTAPPICNTKFIRET